MTRKKQKKTTDKQQGTRKIKSLEVRKQTVRHLSAEDLSHVKGGCYLKSEPAR
jgi:hypothetical protein